MLDPTTTNLQRYMDLLTTRQKLVASNIANADTPGYNIASTLVKGQFNRSGKQSRKAGAHEFVLVLAGQRLGDGGAVRSRRAPVACPNLNPAEEMANLMNAQRSYEGTSPPCPRSRT
jgi:flagellar basal body rod protein FlgC